MAHVLAIDQGTTSSRAILFDERGTIVNVAQREFPQHFPKPGWVEHDPKDIWESQIGVVGECIKGAGVDENDVKGVGITNQRETTVIWERATGRPIHNAIVWQDRRTAEWCDRLKADGLEDEVRSRTGLVIDAYFAASKIAWLLDHVQLARERAARGELAFGTIDSWLVWNLTGGGKGSNSALHATDVSNASRTMLWNIHEQDWDDTLLERFDIPRELLPEVRPSSGEYAPVAKGLPLVGTPIAGIAGDQQAALFGQACYEKGLAKNTFGTGCFLLMNTGAEAVASDNKLITTAAWKIGDQPMQYALEGSVFIAGAIVQWLRDGLGIIKESAEVEKLAKSVPDTGGVYLVPALVGLGAPHWDPYARGAILGITRGTTAAHIARAALEGVAFSVADLADAMQRDSGVEIKELRVDGGAARDDLLMQFQSDILQTPLVRPKVTETTALGAAFLAGLATNVWRDPKDLAAHWHAEKRFEPQMKAAEAKHRRERWNEAVERAKDWEEKE